MVPKHIVIVGYDDITSLDLSGPLEAFSSAITLDGQRCYKVTIAALSTKSFCSESGLRMSAERLLDSVGAADTVLIPGGRGMRLTSDALKLAKWILKRAGGIRRIASVCTGIYGVALTGLLDGRRVTTHWKYANDLAKRYPKLKVDPNALYIQDGKFYTSAGITAGIDLSLALIEEDYGPQVALAVARELVVYVKRPGGQEQFSEPLKFQAAGTSRFAPLAAWILAHLHGDLSVEALAGRVHLSTRQFSRRFKAEFGSTPAAFVQRLRLDESRRRLEARDLTIESIGNSVGFHDPDSFRRAFVDQFGLPPQQYRSRFATEVKG